MIYIDHSQFAAQGWGENNHNKLKISGLIYL